MGPHLLSLALFGGGPVALVVRADALVRGSSKLALALGISPLVAGLVLQSRRISRELAAQARPTPQR